MKYTEKITPPERFLFFVGLLIAALSLISINGGWFSDDKFYVGENLFLKGLPLFELWRLFIPNSAYNYLDWQPVRDVYLKLGIVLFGENPIPLKLMNIGLYLALTALVYRASVAIMSAFNVGDTCRTAAIATAIFILHPVHIESVQWVSGSKDLLMGIFCFAAVPPWLQWVARGHVADAVKTALFMALAVLSKGMAISFFGILWLAAFAIPSDGSSLKRITLTILPVSLLAVLCFAAYAWVSPVGYFTVWQNYDWTQRPLILLGGQLLLALVPYDLSIGYSPYGPLQTLYTVCGVIGLVVTLLAVWCFSKNQGRVFAFGALFFVITVLPHLQLIPYGTTSMISDRFDFLPVYGLAFSLAAGTQRFEFERARVGVGLLLIVLAALVGIRSMAWRNPGEMSANDYIKKGSPLSNPEWQEIVVSLQKASFAIRQSAYSGEKMTDRQLKNILDGLGRAQSGLSNPPPSVNKDMAAYNFFVTELRPIASAYEKLLILNGRHALLGFDGALFFLKQKEYGKAISWASMAIETPGLPPERLSTAYKYLGIAYSETGQLDSGARNLSLAVSTTPMDPAAACYLKRYVPSDSRGPALCP